MKPDDLLNQLQSIYGWDFLPNERLIMVTVARNIGAGKIIEKWTEYQEKFPGHSVKKFQEVFIADKGIPFW